MGRRRYVFSEQEVYAAVVAGVGPPSDPVIDGTDAIFRLCFQVFRIHTKSVKILDFASEATGLFCPRERTATCRILKIDPQDLGDVGDAVKGRWVKLQFSGKLPSGRQPFRILGTFNPKHYSRRYPKQQEQTPVRPLEVRRLLGGSASGWRRFVDTKAGRFAGLVERRGSRKDRYVDLQVLHKALAECKPELGRLLAAKLGWDQ